MTRVPSREQVLRDLFWTLLFRGRTAHEATEHRRGKRMGTRMTVAVYVMIGAGAGLGAFALPPFVFAAMLHMLTLLFASMTLATNAGTMLFVREEAEILLHRPVHAAELLRAKCTVLVTFSLMLALALNAVGLVTSFWNEGNAPWFAIVHATTTLVLMLFSAATIVLVYNVCLRLFGRERFENLLTAMQVLATIVMIAGTQFVPRAMQNEAMQTVDPTSAATLLLPPIWFAALDMLLCGVMPIEQVWLPAAIGVGMTALLAWLAFVKLGSSYGIGLLALGEAAGRDAERPRRRVIAALASMRPLRWWLRDPIERHAFLLTSAYLFRDRETKLKLYPALAAFVMIPVVPAFAIRREGDAGPDGMLSVLPSAFIAILPIQALMLLRRSEQWRAADVFRIAPLPHWTPLFHGARKAVVCWLGIPGLLLVAGALAAMGSGSSAFLLALPAAVNLLVCSCVPGLLEVWTPLSRPNRDFESMLGFFVFFLVSLVAAAVSGVAAAMHHFGWLWPFVIVVSLAGLALQAAFCRSMRSRRWRSVEA